MAALAELLDEGERAAVEEEAEREIRDAIEFAEASPFPDMKALYTDILGS